MSSISSARNILFGILAVQSDFVRPDELAVAMDDWISDKSRHFDELLVEKGFLTETRRQLLAPLVAAHVGQHGGDPLKSLTDLSSVASVREILEQVRDPVIETVLSGLKQSDPEATQTFATVINENAAMFSSRAASGSGDRNRFRIIRPHARGGLGEVFVAQDVQLGREVALKEILKNQSNNIDSQERFVREAEITGGLEHPGIVPVYALGHYEDGRPYYAMRFIRGASLKEAIDEFHQTTFPNERDRNLKLRELLGRFVDVCNAIEYAHSRGVLHRDLKPGNIMLGKYGETLVVDWGLAKVVGRDQDQPNDAETTLEIASTSGSSATQLGSAIGTPAFMSPEQASGMLDLLGPATDVYSLGATLYVVLVGKPAFEGNAHQVMDQVREGRFQSPSAVDRRVPKALSAICVKAMANTPGERYPSCTTIADDIERWLADEQITAMRDPLSARLARLARRHRTAVATLGVFLVASVIGLAINRLLVGVEQQKTLLALDQTRIAQKYAEEAKQEADRNAARAADAKEIADEQREQADQQRVLAETNADRAAKAKEVADQQRTRAEENEGRASKNAYLAAVSRAQQAYQNGNVGEVMDVLRGAIPSEGEQDYRSFEYGFLLRRCSESHRTFRGHFVGLTGLACSPDGQTLVSIAADTTVRWWNLKSGNNIASIQDATVQSLIDVTYSADGKLIAAGLGNEVHLFDATSRKILHKLSGHTQQIRGIVFLPNGDRIASIGGDNRIRIWSTPSGKPIKDFPAEGVEVAGPAWSIAVSPDGKTIAVGAGSAFGLGDTDLRLLDIATAKLSKKILGHTAGIYGVAFSPDGKLLATGSGDWSARIWDVETLTERQRMTGHNGSIASVSFSPDGKSLATASGDRTVKLWNVVSGLCDRTFRAHTDGVTVVKFLPDGNSLVTGSMDRTIRIWPIEARDYVELAPPKPSAAMAPLMRLLGQSPETLSRAKIVVSTEFTPDNNRVVVARMNLPGPGRLEVWDLSTGEIAYTREGRPGALLCGSAVSPDGKYLAMGESFSMPMSGQSTTKKAKVTLYDPSTGELLNEFEVGSDSVTAMAFTPDGQWLVATHLKGIVFFQLTTGSVQSQTRTNDGTTSMALAIRPDSKELAVGRSTREVRFIDIASKKPTGSVTLPGSIFSLAYSGEGKTLAVGTAKSGDQKYLSSGSIYLVDVETRTVLRKFASLTQFCRFVKFTPDGQRIVAVGGDGFAKVFDAETGAEVLSLRDSRPGWSGALSANGLQLAMGNDEGGVKIWSAELGRESGIAWFSGLVEEAIASAEWTDCLRYLEELIRLEPGNGIHRFRKYRALWELDDFENAKQTRLKVWAELPKDKADTVFGNWVGSMFLEAGRHEASKEYRREERVFAILADSFSGGGPSAMLVDFLFRQGNTRLHFLHEEDPAIEVYRKAIDVQRKLKNMPSWDRQVMLQKDVPARLANVAILRHQRAEYNSAERLFLEAIQTHQELFDEADGIQVGLGRLYRDTGRLDEAKTEFEAALQTTSQAWLRHDRQRELISLLKQMGDLESVRKVDLRRRREPPEPISPQDFKGDSVAQIQGLQTTFYSNGDFKRQRAARIDPLVDFIWWGQSPQNGVRKDRFAARWMSWLRPPTPGLYQLRLLIDGAARLWVDGQLIDNQWPDDGPLPYKFENDTAKVDLSDEPHFVQLDYFKPGGTAAVMLQWIPPGQEHAVAIPEECWFLTQAAAQSTKPSKLVVNDTAAKHGLKADLYRGTNFEQFVGSRIDPQIHFFWDKDAPAPDMPADCFSIRWTGKLLVPKDGYYQFSLDGDDGFRLYIDGVEHHGSFSPSGPIFSGHSMSLTAGEHDIKVEYRESFGSAWISLRWQLDGEGGFLEQPIPPEAFLLPEP